MVIRSANRADLEAIVALLADDPLGANREDYTLPLRQCYIDSFKSIEADSNQSLMVLEEDEKVVGTFQFTIIPYLTYRGRSRAQVEAVRVHKEQRGKGLGAQIIEWCLSKARSENAHVLQLTTDKQRPDAIRFYESLGFLASHEGMKLHLD